MIKAAGVTFAASLLERVIEEGARGNPALAADLRQGLIVRFGVLFIGTMYVPSVDRHAPGRGFTHERGDHVEITCAPIGTLENWVEHCEPVRPGTMGVRALVTDLAQRHLLDGARRA